MMGNLQAEGGGEIEFGGLPRHHAGNVMVIDDQPANLKLMEEMLTREGFAVRSFPRGRLALASAAQAVPDLILLDISMPEMDGFEVCARLKADAKLHSVPVIFLSALSDTADKVRAFKCGGVDYITKPFQCEEVRTRVETHLGLQRARNAEHQLLENTLNGAIRALSELIHLTGPVLATRSEAIRSIVVHLCCKLALDEAWQYELAAILCLIGCIALPEEAFERAYSRNASQTEEEMFSTHPENGAELLAKIPRLENVAEIIRRQQMPCGDAPPKGVVETGSCLLQAALDLDRWMFQNLPFDMALGRLKALPHGYPPEVLDALAGYRPHVAIFETKCIPIEELRIGMIAETDVITEDGNFMIVLKGTVLSRTIVERIWNFNRTRGVRQPIRVQMSRPERRWIPRT